MGGLRGGVLPAGFGALALAVAAAAVVFAPAEESPAIVAGETALAAPRQTARAEHVREDRPTASVPPEPRKVARSAATTSRRVSLPAHGRISRVGVGVRDAQANDSLVGRPSLSADGRFVAFASLATNLVPGDRNGFEDVFVRDRSTGRTVLVSATPAGLPGAGASGGPVLSADGRWLAFESWAPDLVAGAGIPHGGTGVYLRDLRTGTTTLLSAAVVGRADGDSTAPSIDATGTRVAFGSLAGNLVPGDRNGHSDVFVWTRGRGLDRVSRDSAGADLPGGAAYPALSADGGRVAFAVAGTRGGGCEDVYAKDLRSGELELVTVGGGCARFSDVAISANGRHVAFGTPWPMSRADRDWAPDVYTRDLVAGRTKLVSRALPGPTRIGDRGGSYAPSLSGDGRWIAFTSFAADLVAADPTYEQDAYLWDRRTGRTTRLAAGARGTTYAAVLSPDAAHVVFGSGAENLVRTDNNHSDDVFAIDRAGARYPVADGRAVADESAPQTEFWKGPTEAVSAGPVAFVLRSDEPGVRYECRVDRGPWRPCPATYRQRFGPGHHLVQARAIDAAGNVDESPAGWRFRVRR
ncbi:MAG: TolB family protein [Sporichthyaceae bacterium]